MAYFKINKNSQNFVAVPVSLTISKINSPFDNTVEIIEHLPVATILIIELVNPLGSQLY